MIDEPFTPQDLADAIEDMGMLRYFPSDPGARAAIARLLAKMVPHKAALRWLVDAMVNRVGEWQGPTELRGVLCWRYKPQDGIEAPCSAAGFNSLDAETAAIEAHEKRKAEWQADARRMIEEHLPLLLEAPGQHQAVKPRCRAVDRTELKRVEEELATAPRRCKTPEEKARELAELEAALQR